MSLSLGEATTLAGKAARGAGLPWGLAEEAGRAARWLEGRGAPGLAAVAALCEAREAGLAGDCPLRLGCAIADGAQAAEGDFGPVAAPLLLLPFLAQTAGRGALALRCGAATTTVSADGLTAGPGGWAPLLVAAGAVRVARAAPSAGTGGGAPREGARADAAAAPRLEVFAARLLAPSDPRLRATGAGPGTATDD